MNISDDLKKIIAAIVIFAVLGYYVYNYVYKPKIKEIKNIQKTLSALEKENVDGTLPQQETDKEKIQKEIEKMTEKIPGETEVPYLLEKFVSEVGKGTDIEYTLIEPQDMVVEKGYKRLPIKLEFLASYLEFDYYLRQLKDLPAAFRIDSLALARSGSANKLKVNMEISTFILPGKVRETPTIALTEEAFASLYDPFSSSEVRSRPIKERTLVAQSVKKAAKKLILQGIWLSDNPKAIISDKVLGIGESINGYEVTAIEEGKVTLVKYGKTTILEMRR